MRKISAALVGASLLALSACGGADDAAVNNGADVYNVSEDDLVLPDNGLDTVTDNGAVVDANAAVADNAADADAAAGNVAGNSQ